LVRRRRSVRGWVRLRVLLVAAGVALTLGAGHAAALPATQAAHPAVVASRDRGLWVWDQVDPAAVVAFALTHRVGRLFLAIPVDVTSTPELLRVQQTIVAAHAVGIKVDALGGDPRMGGQPGLGADALAHPGALSGRVRRGPRRRRALREPVLGD